MTLANAGNLALRVDGWPNRGVARRMFEVNFKLVITEGLLLLCAGLFLLVPQRRADKRERNGERDGCEAPHVARMGFVLCGALAIALLAGYEVAQAAPESRLGHLVSTHTGQRVFGVVAVLAMIATARLLDSLRARLHDRAALAPRAADGDESGRAA